MARNHLRPNHAAQHFQIDRPLYVKGKAIQASGKIYKRGDEFPWRDLGMTPERVANMFPRLLHHKIDYSAAPRADMGDGPPTTGVPHVTREKTAEELLAAKTPADMSVRELRIVAKHVGAPTKRTRAEQQEAVEAALEEA